MDFALIQTAVKDWLGTVTGLPVEVQNEPRKHQIRVAGFCVIDPPTSISSSGVDYYTEEPAVDPDFIVPTVVGRREFTVTIRVISRSQTPNKTSRFYLEKARTSLKKPSVLEHFQANEIAIIDLGPTATFDSPHDDRHESISAAELRLACTVVDTDSEIGTIGTIEVSSHLEDPGGTELPAPPNLDDEIFTVG